LKNQVNQALAALVFKKNFLFERKRAPAARQRPAIAGLPSSALAEIRFSL
jgi:hypothetical protein